MFKKSGKANIRRRRDTEEDESIPAGETSEVEPRHSASNDILSSAKAVSEKKTKSKKGKKVVSVLSFGDEDAAEDETVQIKKSSRSKRIAKQIKKRAQEEKEAQTNGSAKTEPRTFDQPSNKDVHVFRPRKTVQNTNFPSDKSSQEPLQTQFSSIGSGAIPTPSMIHAARKQREMLRKFGSEYIPIDDTQSYKGPSKSRLVREDDFEGSSDEEIMELKGIQPAQKVKPLVPKQSEDEENDAEEDNNVDEEVDRWEEEMIKKGISSQNSSGNHHHPGAYAINPQMTGSGSLYGAYVYTGDSFYNQTAPVQHKQVEAKSDVTLSALKLRIESHLNKAKEVHSDHQAEMDKLIYDTSECKHVSEHLSDTAALSEEYRFYQEMKQYLRDLIGCLREKVLEINRLDSSMHVLLKARSDRLISRRAQDISDESLQCTLGGSKTATAADPDFSSRIRERQARRTRRRAYRQIKGTAALHNDGLSTDDEETSMDQAKVSSDLNKIRSEINEIFDDVIEDFCDIDCILKRFADWRNTQQSSYLDAYISLCIPKLVAPFIKHKLVLWNPLFSVDDQFEDSSWYKSLALYGLEKDSNSAFDDDSKLLASTIEKIIVSKLTTLVQDVWDPMSTQQSARLAVLVKELFKDYSFMSSKNRHCQHLMQALCKRIQHCLENDIFIPLLPPSSKQDIGTEFLERQTWGCVKLFKNILLFDGVLSYTVLCEFAFDSLLNRYIILALQTSPMNTSCLRKCQEIVRSIPRTWHDKHENMHSHLYSLIRLLVHLAKSMLQSGQLSGEIMFKKEIKSMLLTMGARDALAEL